MEEYSQEEVKISKYNSAVAQLYRLNDLWKACSHYSTNGDLMKWNWYLNALWMELGGDVVKDDKVKFKSIEKSISDNISNRSILYQILQIKHIFLKTIENKQGKGTAYMDPEEDSMDE